MNFVDLWFKIQSIVGPILTYLVAFVATVGSFGWIIYGIFKIFAEKWLNAKFEKRLAAYKHVQQRELEQLRFEINALLDRAVKLHQREFDVLPEIWGLLTEAFNITRPVALGAVLGPDINAMTAEQLEDFLEKIPLVDWQKNELKATPDKNRYYLDAISWHDLNRAKDACGKFHVYLLKNGIFIPPNIKKKFSNLDDILAAAIAERDIGLRYKNNNTAQKFEKGLALNTDGQRLLTSLEQDVQNRLWNSQATVE